MDENNLEDENLESSNLEEPVEEPRSEGVVDSVSRTATHTAGRAVATAYGGAIGGKIYDVASNTKIGQAIEESVSKKISLKLKLILIGVGLGTCLIFFIIFSIFISNGDMGTGSGLTDEGCVKFQANCDNKVAKQLAKIVYHEVGNQDLFTQLTTASIVLNNAEGDTYEKIYALTDNQYAGYSSYRDVDFDTDVPDSHRGRMLYVAEVVLSKKYNLPENMHLQASKSIVTSYGKIWTYITSSPYDVYFGYVNGDLSSKDIFGNELPSNAYSDNDKSVEYFKKLAKELELDDYSGYTEDKVCANIPSISNICKSITPSGYPTVSVDEYVAGVVGAEIGGYVDPNFNTYKALAVAARSYALAGATKGNDGACTVPVGPSFQAYSNNPDEDMLNAAKETSGIVLTVNNSIYSAQYDALCIDSSDSSNYYLCQGGKGEEHMILPKDWIVKKKGQSYIDYISQYTHGHGLSQNGAWYLSLERNWDYTKILDYFYGDEGAALASSDGSDTKCTGGGSGSYKPLGSYNFGHAGLNVLDRTLTSSEIDELNKYINSEVDKAGFGTGGGVAAAGQALAYWLELKGYYLQYRWGGGHGYGGDPNSTYVGVNPNWGSTAFGTDYNSGRARYYWGMDCTGFTAWAIRTACSTSIGTYNGWYSSMSGAKVLNSLSEAKPGDVLENAEHIQMVVKNNGDGTVIVAEETGGSTSGLVFTHITSLGSYQATDMSGYYSSVCSKSR